MAWTPCPKQREVWTANVVRSPIFDPAVFDNSPIFDTGDRSGAFWFKIVSQKEEWTTT